MGYVISARNVLMKSLNVGIFHDDGIGKELGKKGTVSDISFFNRKTDDVIFTFMQPVEDKLLAKAQIMSAIDAAIVSFREVSPGLGETILMLDSLGVSRGIIINPPYSDAGAVEGLVRNTILKEFPIVENDPGEIIQKLEEIETNRNNESPVSVVIDHSFNVKGLGEVLLGFVKSGTLRKHDKLTLLPAGKEIVVRSIQMHDKDFDEAPVGSRVGVAIKGASVEELKRGSVLCVPETHKTGKELKLKFEKNKFYSQEIEKGTFHLLVGMQTMPVNIEETTDGTITISTEQTFVYKEDDVFLFFDLNAKKMHLVGKGKMMNSPSV
ncbi:MAG: hypothetical protein JW754_00960 [Candidatus Aenigmarchaeota archaeon]|nr:hypothetical protein [Candidatus Aenigmarchaeota archaeon]